MNFPLAPYLGTNLLRLIAKVRRSEGAPDLESLIKATHEVLHDFSRAGDRSSRHVFELNTAGVNRDLEILALPVHDSQGSLNGRLIVLRDISEEKSMERFREELTHMIVHDLRSPLSGVISSLRLIEEMVAMSDFEGFEQVLGIAITSSENQMKMIESMLEIDKMEQGAMPMHIADVELDPIVHKAISALEVLANAAHVRLIDCVPGTISPLHIDEEQIRRVLINLIDNALRHTPSGGEVRIEAVMLDGKGQAKIGVIDTGKGIPVEFREKIFEKFVQVPKSAIRGHKGIGLGLTFCRLAVEAHGGHIWVDSGPTGGAAFWFTLPLANAADVS